MSNLSKKILIADDDTDLLYQMKIIVENLGFETITADSQRQAELILETIQPDLAILDLMMEKADSGFILAYKIKKKYPNTPVIIATAVTAETGIQFDLTTSENAWIKADVYLEKNLRPEQLEKEIKKLLAI